MGKRSQAKGLWITRSQRTARGTAQSGARIMVMLSKAQKRAIARAQAKRAGRQ